MQSNGNGFKKEYFEGGRTCVYAVIYKDLRLILYNTDFEGDTKIFLIVPGKQEVM
jgi:hypothetical protein